MEFVITEYAHCDLISINGRIDSYSAPKINQALKSLFNDGHHNLVVDMSDVAYISSSGILVFVNAQRQLERQNHGEIVFAGISDLVYSAFELAGFHQLFEFFEDNISAVGKF